jgi:hypothetical protein
MALCTYIHIHTVIKYVEIVESMCMYVDTHLFYILLTPLFDPYSYVLIQLI